MKLYTLMIDISGHVFFGLPEGRDMEEASLTCGTRSQEAYYPQWAMVPGMFHAVYGSCSYSYTDSNIVLPTADTIMYMPLRMNACTE